MSQVIQIKGVAGLFSSALFCLWLSTASLVVWVDFGSAAQHTERQAGQRSSSAAHPEAASAAGDAPADAA